ncbi:SAM-dependent methyltransferase [Kibdelosporangium banguiense]|uniref:SAM-dependent methyltransferase n=1 Tax=Kibdelosporangium banguiense TaxID=1365924 RepID=A0ABS4T8P2_9PSEU|nr:class I SAM-dependent methyltransferase [Kibdelosporangium banguiense]MBP2320691.1 SAM-dependent methyltransferase [Kibdelosporangium banguiense]
MTDYLTMTRDAYDTFAETYASEVPARFAKDPVLRSMLSAFAAQVTGPVMEVGCGPGHVTAHLASLGLSVSGTDLSPRMIEVARRTYPDLQFSVASMTALDLADGTLGGLVSWWSLLHLPPDVVPVAFAEFRRVLAPDGLLVVGFAVGDEILRPESAYGHDVTFDAYMRQPKDVEAHLTQSGFAVTATMTIIGPKRPGVVLMAQKQ